MTEENTKTKKDELVDDIVEGVDVKDSKKKDVLEESSSNDVVVDELESKNEKEDEDNSAKSNKYYEAVGRRKSATARVRVYTKGEGIIVNEKDYKDYFSLAELISSIEAPLKKMKSIERFKVTVKVTGGGPRGQAEAIRHGLARALVVFNADFKKRLKRAGFLKRDPRVKERKKYGLKKARKAPRWAKR